MTINLKRYVLVYLATVSGLVALSVAMAFLLDMSLPSGLSTVLPAWIAAMTEGQKAAEAKAPQFTGTEAWAQGLRMTLACIALNCVFGVLILLSPDARAVVLQAPILVVVLLVLAFGVTFLINRFALTMGHRMQSKAIATKEARNE